MQITETIKKQMNKWLEKHAFEEDVGNEIQPGVMHRLEEVLDINSLSSSFPYQSYDPVHEIYYMEETVGFLLTGRPLSGANVHADSALYEMLQNLLPEGSIFQVKLLASPKIGEKIDFFERSRGEEGGALEEIAHMRANYIKEGAFRNLLKSEEYLFRDYRIYVSVLFEKTMGLSAEKIIEYRKTITQDFLGMGMQLSSVLPDAFLSLLDELLCPRQSLYPAETRWNPLVPLNEQVGMSPMSHTVFKNKILFTSPLSSEVETEKETEVETETEKAEEDRWEIHTFYVQQFPKAPIFFPEVRNYLGDIFDERTRIACPFSIGFTVQIVPQEWVSKSVAVRSNLAKKRAQEQGKKSDKAIKEMMEWRSIVEKAENHERVVDGFFTITVFCRDGQAEKIYSRLKKIFNQPERPIRLLPNYFLHLPMFLSDMPLAQSESVFKLLRKTKRIQRMWVENAANMFPLIAEEQGHGNSQFILGQRLGQILFWDPYLSNTNFNTVVIGDSGSGKSVLVNDVKNSILATGGQVFTIDLGHSYRKQCMALEGAYISFKGEPFSINPFTHIDFDNREELENFLEFMESLVYSMADPEGEKLDVLHKSFIGQAISHTVEKSGNEGGLQEIIDFLETHSDQRANDIAIMLSRYAVFDKATNRPGIYAHFFNGRANLNVTNRFVVFELEGVSNQLKPAILQILVYLVTIKMYLGDRTRKVALVIDEAYDTFKGKEGANIAESVARRARKYGGCLISASQSIQDFFEKPAAMAIYNQSHWLLMMKQKSNNIRRAISDEKISVTDFQEKLMYNMKSEKGDFSEVLILGGSGESALGKLILDPYSIAMYSTEAVDHSLIESYQKRGMTYLEGIKELARERYGLQPTN